MGWVNVGDSKTSIGSSSKNIYADHLILWFNSPDSVGEIDARLRGDDLDINIYQLGGTLSTGVQYRVRLTISSGVYNGTVYSSVRVFTGENLSWVTDFPTITMKGARTLEFQVQKYVPTPAKTPSSISVSPSEVKEGESISISWGTSTYATIYYLQRSINGGSYTNIYNGTRRSYSDTVLSTWNTVSYRVRGYNEDGYSSYRTSSSITVTHFPELKMRVNGSLKTSDNGWVRVNGILKEIDSMWVRVNGTLKEV